MEERPLLPGAMPKEPHAAESGDPDDEFGGMRAVELSGKLAPVYEKIAAEEKCDFMNAALAAKVKSILNE